MAILFAIILWAYVNSDSSNIITQDIPNVPVTINGVEELQGKNLAINNVRNYYVNLKVKGSERNLNNINTNEISAEADLSEINAKGDYTIEVDVKGLSNTVILESITPKTIQITVDEISQIEWDVSVVTDGKPANDNTVISSKTEETVQVSGPSEVLQKISQVTAHVNVQEMEEDSTQHVAVNAYDNDGNILTGVECTPSVVDVEIVMGKTKDVSIATPKTTGNVAEGHKITGISVEPQKITIGAKEDVLATVSSVETEPINVTNADNTMTGEAKLVLPEGVSLLDEEKTNKVNVTVQIEQTIERNYTITRIETKNLGAGLSVSKIKDGSVSVKLGGVASELNAINAEDISVYLDLTGLDKGDHEVEIKSNQPENRVKGISPARTVVTIE